MNAIEAFSAFIPRALTPTRADRYSRLANNPRGQRKLLGNLDHDFERSIRPDVQYRFVNRSLRCFAYHSSVGFGAEFPSVDEAYDRLSIVDGWLIVLADGSGGIYRPEARWDAEVEICG